ncbi:hypothetical protein PENSPDRAFT_752151 [Peniophora sp. CONT]|nr:hypothetical protein PENSPDRAFT_752151 [Peniophora sp. CONT]
MARLTHWKQPATSAEEPDTTMDVDPSLTFQFPEAGHATRLLDMGDDDFLDGMDDSFGSPQRTPQHHTIAQPPLTLEELTPRKKLKNNLRDALSTKMYAESTPFFKRDKFSPVRRTRAGEGEENVQPHDVTNTVTDAAPVRQPSRSPSPKRSSHVASTRPKTQRLASNDDLVSIHPAEKELVVKEPLPDIPCSVAESAKSGQELTRPEVMKAPGTAHSERQPEPLSMASAPRVGPESSRPRQHTRNPSSLRNEAVKAAKAAPVNTARPNKHVSVTAKAVQSAPTRARPKTAKPIGSAVETSAPPQAGDGRTRFAELPEAPAPSAKPSCGVAIATSSTDVLESLDNSSSCVSRPSTPPAQNRRASSPLTLSKLSPSKQTLAAVQVSQPPATTATSAARAPSPVIATIPPPEVPASSAQPKAVQLPKQSSARRALTDTPQDIVPLNTSGPTAGPSKVKAKPAKKVFAGKPQTKKETERRRSSVQRNYCVPSATTKQKAVPRPGALTAKRRAGLLDQEQATSVRRRGPGLASSGESKKPTQRLTKPVEFHFKVESRLSARKPSDGQDAPGNAAASRSASKDPSIPDFAARHALEAERTNARKERIAPTVPHSPEFTVEARLREREKFEEGRRAREAEIEQQREQMRLEREREEEAEMRRLRKLAVPKANAVPEWYAQAPKKGSRSASSSTSAPA